MASPREKIVVFSLSLVVSDVFSWLAVYSKFTVLALIAAKIYTVGYFFCFNDYLWKKEDVLLVISSSHVVGNLSPEESK